MASQGPNNPATAADDSGIGTVAWNNTGNVFASDDARANTSNLISGAISHYLKVTNFSFSIPSGATIDGIVVEAERSSAAASCEDEAVRIVKGGAIGATDKSSGVNYPSTEAYQTYGGATDKWGETWTDPDINASNFGVAFAAQNNTGTNRQARIDHVRITVYYTEGGGGDTELAPADAAQAQTADNVALVQAYVLSVQDAAHGHSADSPALVQQYTLTVADALHAQSADNIDLSGAALLEVADATHSHSADSPGLLQAYTLTVADAAHAQAAENVELITGDVLEVQDAAHGHAAESVALTQAYVLAVAEAGHAQSAETVALVQAYVLAPADALHGQSAENVVFEGEITVTVDLTLHARSLGLTLEPRSPALTLRPRSPALTLEDR